MASKGKKRYAPLAPDRTAHGRLVFFLNLYWAGKWGSLALCKGRSGKSHYGWWVLIKDEDEYLGRTVDEAIFSLGTLRGFRFFRPTGQAPDATESP